MNDTLVETHGEQGDWAPHGPVSEIVGWADASTDRLDFMTIEADILAALEGLPEDSATRYCAWADAVAFGLEPNAEREAPWERYFGPKGYAAAADGARFYIPAVDRLDPRAIALWAHRLDTVSNPVLRARYADACWELAQPVGRTRPSRNHASAAIAAYGQMAEEGKAQSHFEPHDAGLRMLTLAVTVNDGEAMARARDILLDMHRSAKLASSGMLLPVIDGLLNQRRLQLETSVVDELIGDLEIELDRSIASESGLGISRAEAVANRLRLHYSRNKSLSELRGVHARLAGAFEALSDRGSALAATSHLDRAALEYDRAGDRENATRVRIGRADAVARSSDEMVENSVEIRIGFDEMEAFLDKVVEAGKPGNTLCRIADMFPTVEAVADAVRSIAASAPIQAIMPFSIMEDEHVAAVVGSVAEDLEGRVMHQAGQDSSFSAFQLDAVLERAVMTHDLAHRDLAGWAGREGAFSDLSAVTEGLRAWFDGDWWKCLFVLTPQIEVGLRGVLKSLGQATVKDHPTQPGRQILLNMGEVLASPALRDAMGTDVILYFRSRYVDPRGRNLRNVVAHGLAGDGEASSHTCDMLVQSLLVLGCWRTIAEIRRRRASVAAAV